MDLSLTPPEAATACRLAWPRLAGSAEAVVHGDPGPSNIRIASDGSGLLDWVEAGVDYADLDLADLPIRSYARSQLARLRGGQHSFG